MFKRKPKEKAEEEEEKEKVEEDKTDSEKKKGGKKGSSSIICICGKKKKKGRNEDDEDETSSSVVKKTIGKEYLWVEAFRNTNDILIALNFKEKYGYPFQNFKGDRDAAIKKAQTHTGGSKKPRLDVKAALLKNQRCDIFNHLSPEMLNALINGFDSQTFAELEVIIEQGVVSQYFYLVETGKVFFSTNNAQTKFESAGSTFGETSILFNVAMPESVTAFNEVKLWKVPKEHFTNVMLSAIETSRTSKKELLRNVLAFHMLTVEDCGQLAEHVHEVSYPAGHAILRKKEENGPDSRNEENGGILFVVVEGEVKLEGTVASSLTLGSGHCFGESSFNSDSEIEERATALTPTTVYCINRHTMDTILEPCEEALGMNLAIQVLDTLGPVQGLDIWKKHQLIKRFKYRHFHEGEPLCQQFLAHTGLYIITKGRGGVYIHIGTREPLIHQMGPGDFIGDIGFYQDDRYQVSIMTKDKIECVQLHRQDIKDAMAYATDPNATHTATAAKKRLSMLRTVSSIAFSRSSSGHELDSPKRPSSPTSPTENAVKSPTSLQRQYSSLNRQGSVVGLGEPASPNGKPGLSRQSSSLNRQSSGGLNRQASGLNRQSSGGLNRQASGLNRQNSSNSGMPGSPPPEREIKSSLSRRFSGNFSRSFSSLSRSDSRLRDPGTDDEEEPNSPLDQSLETEEGEAKKSLFFTSKKTQDRKTLMFVSLLGGGAFGSVHLVQNRVTKEVFAMKVMNKRHLMNQGLLKRAEYERRLTRTFKSPFIVQFFWDYADQNEIYIKMEYLQGGDLYNRIHHKSGSKELGTNQIVFYLASVCEALFHIHGHEVCYRDIKPENIMLTSTGYVKLVDFGTCKYLPTGKLAYTLVGSPEYLSPEAALANGYSQKADFWATGILLCEMMFTKTPFKNPRSDKMQIVSKILETHKINFPRGARHSSNASFRDAVRNLANRQLNRRAADKGRVKALKIFEGFNFRELRNGTMKAPWIPCLAHKMDISNFSPIVVDADFNDED